MVGIAAIASYVPPHRESNFEKSALFGTDEAFIREKIGVEQVSRKDPAQETSDLCVEAWKTLSARHNIAAADVDCAIVCTQHPDGRGIPNTAAIVHGKLGFVDHCATFDISLGCSGYVYGLAVATSFMNAHNLRCGLFFTADPYSPDINPADKNTALLFGDAATVTLLQPAQNGSALWMPTAFSFATRGRDGGALHNREGKFHMEGRSVFNFTATSVPPQIKELLERTQLSAADIDLYLLHQGSRFIVETLQKRLGLPTEKVPCYLADQGNTVSSSIPLLFEHYYERTDLKRVLISGFGVGLSWASGVIEYQPGTK